MISQIWREFFFERDNFGDFKRRPLSLTSIELGTYTYLKQHLLDIAAYAPEHQYQYNQLIDGGRDDDEDNGVFGLDQLLGLVPNLITLTPCIFEFILSFS